MTSGKNESTRKAYDTIAEEYHSKRQDPGRNAWNEALEVPFMERWLRDSVRGKRILDLGCGTGILTQKLGRWGAHAFGADLSPQMIAIAEREAESAGHAIPYAVAHSSALPYGDQIFHGVASSLMLHYLEDWAPTLREVHRVTQTGGTSWATFHHPFMEVLEKETVHQTELPQVRPYFPQSMSARRYTWQLCGVEIENFHHTLEEIFMAFTSSGWHIEELLEFKPDPKLFAPGANPLPGLDYANRYPTFMGVRARRS
jgi:ubiquinone/menaquinone biosynthesis C-methylase UbiE